MRLATLRTAGGTRAARVDGDTAVELDAPDVGALLAQHDWREQAAGTGRVIATGTPGGVGHARKPPRYLTDVSVLVTEIEGIGRLEYVARAVAVVPV
jgi:acylpyruvate hydrolase